MSLRKAVNNKCRECIYDSIGGRGTWRQQVEACTCRTCPLWPVRPLSVRKADAADDEEVDDDGE